MRIYENAHYTCTKCKFYMPVKYILNTLLLTTLLIKSLYGVYYFFMQGAPTDLELQLQLWRWPAGGSVALWTWLEAKTEKNCTI